MRKHFLFISALLILANICLVQAELKFVVELYRHGARGPLGNWYDANKQLEISGELTSTGMRQHFNLGQKLREEYKGFLPSVYNHSQIYVRSSDVNRTLMSAASQIQGMFPLGTGAVLPQNLTEEYTLPYFKDAKSYLKGRDALPNDIQVIPIHTQPSVGDIVLQPDNNCKNYDKLKKAYYAQLNETIAFVNQQFNNTYQQYSQIVNQTVKSFDDMHSLESVFECDRYNGRFVPNFSPELRSNASYLTSLSWTFMYQQPDILRAMNTPFFEQLLSYINPVVQNTNQNGLKWVMYSAHDTNVHLVSAALNLTSIECLLAERFPQYQTQQIFYNCEQYPHFTSSLIFELHQADQKFTENDVQILQGQFYFKIRRDGKFMNLCQRNSQVCSYEEFNQRIQNFVNNFDEVCNGNIQVMSASEIIDSKITQQVESDSKIFYILGLVVQQLIIIAGCLYFYRSRSNKKIGQHTINIEDTEIQTRILQ